MTALGTTIGTTGAPWRATVTAWGAVEPWDGSPVLDWFVGADDRWHVPAREASVRHRRLDGTPVVETAVRVPSGDAVQRVYAVPGHCVVEVENRSPLPFAVAFTRGDLRSKRRPADVPVQGIDLPVGSVAFGVPHQQTLVVTLPFDASAPGAQDGLPDALPPADAVVRGWVAQAERGSRLVLPDDSLAEAVVAARCSILLDPIGDPERWSEVLFRSAEWCRMGERADVVLDAVVESAYRVARSVRKQKVVPRSVARALRAGADALALAGEGTASADVDAMAERLTVTDRSAFVPREVTALPDGELIDAVRAALIEETDGRVDVLPGWTDAWLGQGLEVHRLRTRWGSASYAVRWHGERPALLWELDGAPADTTVRCSGLDPSWSRTGTRGDALLARPGGAPAGAAPSDPGSFS